MAACRPGDTIIAPPAQIGRHVTLHAAGAAGLSGLVTVPAPVHADGYTVVVDALRALAHERRPNSARSSPRHCAPTMRRRSLATVGVQAALQRPAPRARLRAPLSTLAEHRRQGATIRPRLFTWVSAMVQWRSDRSAEGLERGFAAAAAARQARWRPRWQPRWCPPGFATGLAGAVLAAVIGLCPWSAAQAQQSIEQCRAELPATAAARLKLCDAHTGCRAVLRIIDSCPALQTFAQLLVQNGTRVDDSVLRRTLVDAGVPATGLASCTTAFNRALCRNFLRLEDASGETASGPTRTAQFEAALARLVEQQQRASVPADAHRHAELKLEACGLARPGPERDTPCREAIQAVQACELARQVWMQRREVLKVDAQRLGRPAAQQTLRTLEMPPCPQTVPGTNLTPQEALVSAAADVPGTAAPAPRPQPQPQPQRMMPVAATATATTTATVAPDSADCKTALRRMEERFDGIQRRRPAQADRLASQQVEIYMLTEQKALLERLCRGQREHDFLRLTQERLARALQGCREIAANPASDCVARVAW